MCACACVCVCMRACMWACVRACVHVCACACECVSLAKYISVKLCFLVFSIVSLHCSDYTYICMYIVHITIAMYGF